MTFDFDLSVQSSVHTQTAEKTTEKEQAYTAELD